MSTFSSVLCGCLENYANFIIKQKFCHGFYKNTEIIGYQKRSMGGGGSFDNLSAKDRGITYKKGAGRYQNLRLGAKVKEHKVWI